MQILICVTLRRIIDFRVCYMASAGADNVISIVPLLKHSQGKAGINNGQCAYMQS